MANKKINELLSRTPSLSDLMLVGDPSSGYSYKCTVHDIANIIESDIGDAYVTLTTTQTISGAKTFSNVLALTSVANSAVDTDKFLVLTASNTVNYRTGAEVLSDIGGASSSSISGTTNYVAKFTSSSAVGNSIIFDNGTNVGISTTSPSYKLDVSGSLRSTTSSYFATGGGNIGIGTTGVTGIGGPILQIHAPTYPEIHLTNSTTGDQYQDGTSIHVSGSSLNILNYESGSINLSTSGTQRVSIASDGNVTLSVIANATTDTDKFLVSDSGVIKYRTGAELLSDIGGQGALTLTTTGTSGAATLVGNTLNIPNYAPDLSGYVPTSRTLTINGTAYDLSANRTWSVGTVTSVGLSSATSGVTIGSTPITTSGTITLAIATASGTQQGLLSSTDWTTFNNKQNALTNPVTGTGNANRIAMFTGTSTIGNSSLYYDATYQNIGIKTAGGPITFKNYSALSFDVNAISANSTTLQLTRNVSEFDGWLYLNGSAPAMFQITGGNDFTWSNSTSGTAGTTITWNERMRLDASGNLGIGTSSPAYKLDVTGTLRIVTPNRSFFVTSNAYSISDGTLSSGIGMDGAGLYLGNVTSSTGWTIGNPQLTLTSSGNLGLGVTPSAANLPTIENQYGFFSGQGEVNLTANAYYNSGFKYISTGSYAARYHQSGFNGQHQWFIAPSGTAGNAISFTQAMTLDASGRLGIGTTSPNAPLHILGANQTNGTVQLEPNSAKGTISSYIHYGTTGDWYIRSASASGKVIINDTGGNVGIGTTSPTSLLHLAASTNVVQTFTTNSVRTGYIESFNNGSTAIFNIFADQSATPLAFGTNGNERMRITSGGNVGIGTSSPKANLHIRNGATSLSSSTVTYSSTSAQGLILDQQSNTNNNGSVLWFNNDDLFAAIASGRPSTGNWGTDLRFYTHPDSTTNQLDVTERMRITSGGEVGIGVTSPGAKLEVNGAIKTAAPSGYTAGAWKLGDVTVTSITVDTDKYISVDINGTVYNIPTCHPN